MVIKKYNFLKRNKIDINIKAINSVIDVYNRNLYKYTQCHRGRLPKIKEDFTKIPSNKFMSLEEYLNSVSIWKQIRKFMKEFDVAKMSISDYIDTMMKNWNDITTHLNLTRYKNPIAKIIFSNKLVYLCDVYTEKENVSDELNKHLAAIKTDDFYRLTPSLQSNVNSLFRLKNLNSDLKYKEIISIFSGEFEQQFIDIINNINEKDITEEKITNLFK